MKLARTTPPLPGLPRCWWRQERDWGAEPDRLRTAALPRPWRWGSLSAVERSCRRCRSRATRRSAVGTLMPQSRPCTATARRRAVRWPAAGGSILHRVARPAGWATASAVAGRPRTTMAAPPRTDRAVRSFAAPRVPDEHAAAASANGRWTAQRSLAAVGVGGSELCREVQLADSQKQFDGAHLPSLGPDVGGEWQHEPEVGNEQYKFLDGGLGLRPVQRSELSWAV